MIRKTLGLRGFALATMAVTALPLAAEAQQITLEEIVVTARKRTESLQEIPVAITAFTSRQMEAIGAPNLVDLAKFTPGLQFNDKTWLAGQHWSDFSADRDGLFPFEFTIQQGIALTAPKFRQFGVRASYNF